MECPGDDWLVELTEGRVDASSLTQFHEHVDRCPTCRELVVALARQTASGAAELTAGQVVAHYRIERRVGRGGMGVVYAAFDTSLRRRVALKFVLPHLAGEESLRARLKREARAASALDHPAIGQVYEVGEHEGSLFLAMPFYEGETIKDRLAQGPFGPRETVELLADIAGGLAAAHSSGIVHRDVKPANIMVARDGRPRLLDFGLAKTTDAETLLTTAGHLLGTIAYMAPEQQGGAADPRSDVWAMGVTAYEMLTGKLPFLGPTSWMMLHNVIHLEPPQLRGRQGIDIDLDTIVFKCLEKDPERRYRDGAALAADLRRWLAGEPTSARPVGVAHKLARRVRRQRLALVAIALGAAVIALGTAMVKSRLDAQTRVERAQRLGQTTQRMRDLMRNAYLLPLHDIRHEREQVEGELRSIADEARRTGDGSGGLAEYALGWGNLVLERYAEARPHLLAAHRNGQRSPEVAWAIALDLVEIYLDELGEAYSQPALRRAAELDRLQREFRPPILDYVKAADGVPGLPASALEAMVALADRRYAEAADKAVQVFEQQPSMYEMGSIAAAAYFQQGTAAWLAGKSEEAFAAFDRSAETDHRVAAVARSNDGVRIDEAKVLLGAAYYRYLADQDGIDERYQRILALCEEASQIVPNLSAADEMRAGVFYRQAERLNDRGEDSRPLLEKAASVAAAVERRDPRSWRALLTHGSALASLGTRAAARGENPRPLFEPAWDALQRSLALHRDSEQGNQLSLSYAEQAQYEAESGGHPLPYWDKSAAWGREVLEYEPENETVRNNLGCTLMERATYELDHGIDAEASIRDSEEAFKRSHRDSPNDPMALANLADLYALRGRYLTAGGGDPREILEQAAQAGEKAVAMNGALPTMYGELADAWSVMAWNDRRHGRDPSRALARARASGEAAIRISGQVVGARLVLAQLDLEEAERQLSQQRSSSASRQRAHKYLAGAHAINSGKLELRLLEAQLDRLDAVARIQQRQSPKEPCRAGAFRLAALLEKDPRWARAWAASARLERDCAAAEVDPARRAAAEARAKKAHDRAIAIDRLADTAR